LWKNAAPEHIMKWPSPWGIGFPGWHLECSAMSTKYLGDEFDIHGGGMDLKFPHHECEIAQGCSATGKKPVKYWMHTNMLTLNGKKMSKSTGNTLNPDELFSGQNDLLAKAFDPMVVRFFMMQAHYRSVLDFSSDALNAAEKGYKRLMNAIKDINATEYKEATIDAKENSEILALCDECYTHMNDDFNTPRTIASLFELVTKINHYSNTKTFGVLSSDTFKKLKKTMNGFVFDVLGLKVEEAQDSEKLDGVVQLLLSMRNQAKADKNYALSDQIRDKLADLGVKLKDGKEGTTYSLD
jgi:cysteinyl-tRNA synthetase